MQAVRHISCEGGQLKTVHADIPRAAGRLTFYAGMAVVLAALVREHDEPTIAANIARDNGVTLKDLREGGADPFDLKALRGHIG